MFSFLTNFINLILNVNKYHINTEDKLQDNNFLSELYKFYSSGSKSFFSGEAGIKIYYKIFLQKDLANEKGAILISSGRTEFALSYQETIYNFFNNGYSVYIIDHRGQGFSDRIYKQDCELGHVDSFQNYVDDLKSFYELKIKPVNHSRIFLLGHSMGGTISLFYLEQFPNDFTATALTSPMLGFDFPTCTTIRIFKNNKIKYAYGKGNYIKSLEPFSENTITNSLIRYQILMQLNEEFPQVKLGGPSYQWVFESCEAIKKIFTDIKKICTPLLLLHGTDEQVVSTSAHKKFLNLLKKLNKPVEEFNIDGAKHELLIEKDLYRIPAITKILDFFSSVDIS